MRRSEVAVLFLASFHTILIEKRLTSFVKTLESQEVGAQRLVPHSPLKRDMVRSELPAPSLTKQGLQHLM
jgi:hypothetical protein